MLITARSRRRIYASFAVLLLLLLGLGLIYLTCLERISVALSLSVVAGVATIVAIVARPAKP